MRIRTNEEIKTKQDILFLINVIIDRQTKYFNEEDILQTVLEHITNSPVICSENELREMINETLDISYRYGFLRRGEKGYCNNF